MRTTHNLVQGSGAWAQFRLEHFGASEAAAMLGLSKKVKRSELLHMKHAGTAREFSDWVQQHILDNGHRVEALARPIVETLIEQDLYPVTCSLGRLSASCDGLTMDDAIAFEHKQWNEESAALVRDGVVPPEHMPQCQQVLLVTGAQRLVFVVSDGTPERLVRVDVLPDAAWFERLRAGWAQFEQDLADYVPPEPAPAASIGHAPETLPALRIEISGEVTASNLDAFKQTALVAIRAVNRDLKSDQDFADADVAVKWCTDVESRLAAAKQHALSQTATIDALFKAIDDISAEARTVRLELDKLVTKRKAEIRDGIVLKAKNAYAAHVDTLKTETEDLWTNLMAPDFAAAVKSKRTIATLQDAVDTALANGKIEADAAAKRIRDNLACINAEKEHLFLFNDKALLIHKPLDDLKLVVQTRVAAHKAQEDEKARTAAPAVAVAPPGMSLGPSRVETMAAAPAPGERGTVMSGEIGRRLGFSMTVEFITTTLGVAPTHSDRRASYWTEGQFKLICTKISAHALRIASTTQPEAIAA